MSRGYGLDPGILSDKWGTIELAYIPSYGMTSMERCKFTH